MTDGTEKRTTPETLAIITTAIAGAGNVRSRKMFGEYAIYCDEKVVALACRDELFVKDTRSGRALAPELELAPAYPGAKPGLHIPRARWNNTEWMAQLVRVTTDELLGRV